jgi:hypothetical protein
VHATDLIINAYSSLLQIFYHAEGFLDIRNLIFEATSPLCEVLLHVAILSVEKS